MAESLRVRAARYFGMHDKLRCSAIVGQGKVAIVTEEPPLLMIYEEDWCGRRGTMVKLTDKRRNDLIAALSGPPDTGAAPPRKDKD